MNIQRYEVIKKVIDIVKKTNPTKVEISDYSDNFSITFNYKEIKKEDLKKEIENGSK